MCDINIIVNNIYTNILLPKLYVFIIVLIMLHKLIRDNGSTKYFMIHFLFNMYVVCATYRDMLNSLIYVNQLYKIDTFSSFTIIIFHIYHIIAYKNNITYDDIIHHILNVFVIIPITWLHSNNLISAGLFFMTGLPGGIIYLCLWLRDHKYISKITEKTISKNINIWIRSPGCIIVSYLIWQGANTKQLEVNCSPIFYNLLTFILIGGIYWNGIYFANTIVESYTMHKYNKS